MEDEKMELVKVERVLRNAASEGEMACEAMVSGTMDGGRGDQVLEVRSALAGFPPRTQRSAAKTWQTREGR